MPLSVELLMGRGEILTAKLEKEIAKRMLHAASKNRMHHGVKSHGHQGHSHQDAESCNTQKNSGSDEGEADCHCVSPGRQSGEARGTELGQERKLDGAIGSVKVDDEDNEGE